MHNRQAKKDDWKFITGKLCICNVSQHNFFMYRNLWLFAVYCGVETTRAYTAGDTRQSDKGARRLLVKLI